MASQALDCSQGITNQERDYGQSLVHHGAGSGIGAGTAKATLKAGDRVGATGRNLDKLRNALRDETSDYLGSKV